MKTSSIRRMAWEIRESATWSSPVLVATCRSHDSDGVMTCSKHLLNHTLNTFSPRVGFAWDPTKQGKMSVRGGFGIFYDKPSEQLYNDYFTNSPKFALGSACAQCRDQSSAVCPRDHFGSALQLSPPPRDSARLAAQWRLDQRPGQRDRDRSRYGSVVYGELVLRSSASRHQYDGCGS